jgi:hypothetical protein
MGHTTIVLKPTLQRIAQGELRSRQAELPIPFVCQYCKSGFLFDWARAQASGMIETPLRLEGHEHEKLWCVIAECGDSSCNSQVELFSIHSDDTIPEEVLAGVPTWNLSGFVCEKGHPLVAPQSAHLRKMPSG